MLAMLDGQGVVSMQINKFTSGVSQILAVVILSILLSGSIYAGVVYEDFGVDSADGAWAYLKATGVGKNNSIHYVPRLEDAAEAVFWGYVLYPPDHGWLNLDVRYFDEDSIRIFRTFLRAESDMILPLAVGIDDGHSIYVDGVFVEGKGFGIESFASISLTAGVPVMIEILGYNGPGPSQVTVVRSDNRLPIETTAGLEINASGHFHAVPEPGSVLIYCLGCVCLLILSGRMKPGGFRKEKEVG
jgi:hypothetical protein